MRLIHSLEDAQLAEESVVTIGSFDGVHRGHQSLIAGVRESALKANRAAVVMTFFPHPSVVLGRAQPFYLTSPEEKLVQINQTGADLLIEWPFTPETAPVRAAEFVDQLVRQPHMRELWIGHDFALGYQREGNADFLARLGDTRGFTVKTVEPITNDGEVISSSGIRAALTRWRGGPCRAFAGPPVPPERARGARRRARPHHRHSYRESGRVAGVRRARQRRLCVPRVGRPHCACGGDQHWHASHADRSDAAHHRGAPARLRQGFDGINVTLDFVELFARRAEIQRDSRTGSADQETWRAPENLVMN